MLPRELPVAMLNDCLEAMAAPVQAFNGQILKFMRDGLRASFDVTGRDDMAVCADALAAAAELRAVFPVFNEAGRIQALCRPLNHDILISSKFQETAGTACGLQSVGFHALRGVSEPQELFGLAI